MSQLRPPWGGWENIDIVLKFEIEDQPMNIREGMVKRALILINTVQYFREVK